MGKRIGRAVLGSIAGLLLLAGTTSAQSGSDRVYRVQVAAHTDRVAAARELEVVSDAVQDRWAIHVLEGGGFYRVQVGDFVSIGPARRATTQMRSAGYGDAWIAHMAPGARAGREVPLGELALVAASSPEAVSGPGGAGAGGREAGS